jgi:RNA polymerase sigma-70 factor (ECF subfamily)
MAIATQFAHRNELDIRARTDATPGIRSSDEAGLVASTKAGNVNGFDELFMRHEARIFRIALRMTRNHEDAEDVVQQSFQKAFVHLHKFEGKSSFSTWLTRIAINEALMLLRRSRALSEVPIDVSSSQKEASPALELADAGPDPEATCVQREEAQLLSAAMSRLRPAMRRTIELRELGELSTEETAGHLGVSVGAVKARVFHARRKLGKTLRPYMRPRRFCESDILDTTGNAKRSSQNRMTCNA